MTDHGEVIKGMHTGIYRGPSIGIHRCLRGERATLMLFTDGTLKAQFDDVSTGLGHGWTRFQQSDWEIDDPIDWSEESDIAT